MNAKCPSCGKAIHRVILEPGPLGDQFTGPLVSGYMVVCPDCRAALGAVPDLDAIADKVVARIKKAK